METKQKVTKEDWEKILTETNQLVKEAAIHLLVFQNTAEMAREHLKNFVDDGKNKRLLDKGPGTGNAATQGTLVLETNRQPGLGEDSKTGGAK